MRPQEHNDGKDEGALNEGTHRREPSRDDALETLPANIMLHRIAQVMTQLCVAPLPRNYALFYEAARSPSPDLGRDLAALGVVPSQAALDAIGLQHRLPGHIALVLGDAQNAALQAVAAVTASLATESRARKKDIKALDTFLNCLEVDPITFLPELAEEAHSVRGALVEAGRRSEKLSESLEACLASLGDTQAQIETDRRTLLRDGLTGLPNAAAFALKTAALFDETTADVTPAALVLVTVERLPLFFEKHGTDIGEKAVRKCATLFRNSVKKSDVVARIEEDTFGFLLYDATDLSAQSIAARIRDAVQSLQIRLADRGFAADSLSLSAGIASTATVTGSRALLQQARAALTMVRADGRQGILRCTPLMCAQLALAQQS